jgi:Tol biopolymer transport system component
MKAHILAALVALSALGCDAPTEPQPADGMDAKLTGRILLPRGRIVFTKNSSEVWIMNANGSDERYVTTGYHPVLSPVDDLVAFVRVVSGVGQIFTKDLNTHSSGDQLTFGTASSKDYPAFSPDGWQIVYNGYGDSELWVMNRRGARQRLLYDASASIAQMAAWSPDGSKIAFRDGGNVLVMNADGTGVPDIITLSHLGHWTHPSWSPDGSRLAIQGRELGGEDIYTIKADGTDLRLLTTNPGYDGQPSWGPTGIAYASGGNIWVYSLGTITQINSDAAPDGGPDWR